MASKYIYSAIAMGHIDGILMASSSAIAMGILMEY